MELIAFYLQLNLNVFFFTNLSRTNFINVFDCLENMVKEFIKICVIALYVCFCVNTLK